MRLDPLDPVSQKNLVILKIKDGGDAILKIEKIAISLLCG